jgi:predicted DCC family thiol-disulfide oxidoreductase YuxK
LFLKPETVKIAEAFPMSRPEKPMRQEGRHVLLYDGVCGVCSGLVQFVLRYDRRSVFVFAPLQSATGRSIVERGGGNPDQLTTLYVVADYDTAAARLLTRSNAALFVVHELGWPWKLLEVLRFAPRRLRDRAYEIVARNRYRLFGQLERCLVPSPQFRDRFIDGATDEQ